MTMLASQITSLTVVYSIVYSGVNQRKHQSSASLAFVREIHRGPVNFPHKWPVTRKMFPFDDVIMFSHEHDIIYFPNQYMLHFPCFVLFTTLRPRQDGRHFTDDIFICIFLNEKEWIWNWILPNFIPKGPINNMPALVQIMAWRRTGDKLLSEAMLSNFIDAYNNYPASMC